MTINVVYLSYYNEGTQYGLQTLEDFFTFYKKNPAGIKHKLTVVAKNWSDPEKYKRLCELAAQNDAKVIDLPDDGWDFGAYFRVAKLLDDDYLFFVGTSCLIYTENWLSHCYNAFKSDDAVQLVGPMASWGDSKKGIFPNFHIRTCCFMMKRDLFLEYASTQKFPVTKEDTYELEHGEHSLTKFVLNRGGNAVVVDNSGAIFSPQDWAFSATFRFPGQMNSIMVDKQAVFYYTQDDATRRFLERAAWGMSLKATRIKIFIAHHRQAPLLESEVFQPVFTGANNFQSTEYALRDNVGINISEKNDRYRELTGHYYVCRNILPKINTEYIGFFHYHRFLDFNLSFDENIPFLHSSLLEFKDMCVNYSEENMIKFIQDADIVLPHKFVADQSIQELFLASSPKGALDLALGVLIENYPEYIMDIPKVMAGKELYPCLIFVMRRGLVAEYMEFSFNILSKLEQIIDWSKFEEEDANKIMVNISELLFNIWLARNVSSRNLKVSESSSVFVDGM